MGDVLLLDLDGTLTEARSPLTEPRLLELAQIFDSLVRKGFTIGIVTGSPLGFMQEQIGPLWGMNVVHWWLPCNGTQAYRDGQENPVHDVDMRENLGQGYRKLVREILTLQARATWNSQLPLTGSFLTFRGSMINWSPSGRDGTSADREGFKELDQDGSFRDALLDHLLQAIPDLASKVVVTKGGQTSFDIYPKGWDKTYCLRHFAPDSHFYFVGDATHPGGNDHSIATHPKVMSVTTSNPQMTLDILRQLSQDGMIRA